MAREFMNQPVKDIPTGNNFEELKKIIRELNVEIQTLKTTVATLEGKVK